MKGRQSWITYASDDSESIKALILARSLRRVVTTRLLTIFVTCHVTALMKKRLEDEFDRCITICQTDVDEYLGIRFSTIAQINCWKLTNLRKFVFVDCNCMVIKNSDELFGERGSIWFKGDGEGSQALVSDSPSTTKFKKLVDYAILNHENLKSVEVVTAEAFGFQDLPNERLHQKYLTPVNLRKVNLEMNLPELKIVGFADLHPVDILEKDNLGFQGILEETLFKMAIELIDTVHSDALRVKLQMHSIQDHKKRDAVVDIPLNLKDLDALADSVAIVGMGLRFPGANNLDEFWELLVNGREGIVKVPTGRWTEDQCVRLMETIKETHAGFLKGPVDEIDAKFFGVSPMEVSYMDPQQRLTLQIMWEALEHAGINPENLRSTKTGVFGGWWRNDYKEMLQEAGLNEQEFFRTYMGNALGTLTGRISHVLGLTGPSISTESGCSTSIVAVDLACKSLLNEDCNVGLAFGVNLLLHPFSVNTMNSVISMDGRCKTFDASADGFGRAEGCSVLVLKRFSDAVRDRDRVWGVIRGSAVVQEGPSRSMGTPTVQCESLAMELALENAGVEPNEVGFVETHGTGTPIGDPLEIKAIAKAYSKDRETNLVIGSVKTNIGHTESCSGIAGIIKTILALEHETIPPHRNFTTLNPEINLTAIPAVIPFQPLKWQRTNGKPRIAGVSSFGITGTDAHVIIQETPDIPKSGLRINADIPVHILKMSAKSAEALEDMRNSYKAFITKTEMNLNDICFTANIGRGDFPFRTVVTGSDKSDILKQLNAPPIATSQVPPETPKICFLFTGQGSQYPGMAKCLYIHSPVFKHHFDACNSILFKELGISIKDAVWGERAEDLKQTIYSQTSIFCIEYCLLKLWETWGVMPDCVLGHSLGEFAAAVAAGILSFTDALTLVSNRSRLIDSLPRGSMIVVKESRNQVDMLMKGAFAGTQMWLDYAAINSESQTVLAGSEENVRYFSEFCSNNKIKTHVLEATHAFHSRHMDPILEEYKKTASKIEYGPSNCSYISGVDGKLKTSGEVDSDYWVRHTREPVRFTDASQAVLETGNTMFLEIGPQPILSALIMINADTLGANPVNCLPSMRKNANDWSTILSTLGTLYSSGIDIKWDDLYQFSTAKKVTIPFYPFQNKPYWFESKGDKPAPIHALVGAPVPNPSQLILFQSHINLYNIPYLKDHAIGNSNSNTIIMPGAGFLEMCLVAGHAASQGVEGTFMLPTAPVTLEDFIIEGPLLLTENEETETQTVVATQESGETRVTVYSKISIERGDHKWIRHASGVFSPFAVQNQDELGMSDTLESIMARCTQELEAEDTYEKFADLGLKFGPSFTTLKAAFKGENEIYFKICQPELNTDRYILHPVIIDAIFQATAIASNPNANQLHVPISVTKFIWHARLSTQVCYIHGRKNVKSPEGEYISVLFDNNGQRIATVIGSCFMQTSVNTLMSAIEAQRTNLPNMYQEIWKHQLGPWEKRIPENPCNLVFTEKCCESNFKDLIILNEERSSYYKKSNKLNSLYMMNAMLEVGWDTTKVGETVSLKFLMTSLKIKPIFKGLTRYILTVLLEEGYLKILTNDLDDLECEIVKTIPSIQIMTQFIDELYAELDKEKFPEAICVHTVARKLGAILSGRESALPILFPDDEGTIGLAEQYYLECELHVSSQSVMEVIAPAFLEEYTTALEVDKKVLRILEVGAGTGSFTREFIKQLNSPPTSYEYTYTDISSAFFTNGEKIFENSKIKVIFKKLNLEEDPTAQGFIPHSYDIVCSSFVVHATKDVRKSIGILRNLLRPCGNLVLIEAGQPLRGMNLMFGVLDGFWAFTDFDLRPHNCEMSAEKWEMVLLASGFTKTRKYSLYEDHAVIVIAKASENVDYILQNPQAQQANKWLIFSDNDSISTGFEKKLSEIGKTVIVLRRSDKLLNSNEHETRTQPTHCSLDMENMFKTTFPTSTKQLVGIIYLWGLENNDEENLQSICEPFLNLCKILVRFETMKLLVVTKGCLGIGDHEVSTPFPVPLLGMLKALQNENQALNCRFLDLELNSDCDRIIQETFSEIFNDESEVVAAYRGTQRNVPRLVPYKTSNQSLVIPNVGAFQLNLPVSNAIRDLRFGTTSKKEVKKDEVEIRVKSYSLNFRDLLVVLKPDASFESWNTVGIDFAGVVSSVGQDVKRYKVGDAVLGVNLNGNALPSHLVLPEDVILATIPKEMTFNEAATLPAVVATVYSCLLEGSKLKKGDTILIHTGSGGVGLCAIQVAKAMNCNIISTAGSVRKRAYLRNLGIKHVFNSRTTDYGHEIREALGGNEIDFVLNSLTGPGFKEASLGLCKPGARFVEMSKLNIWTVDEVQKLRPDIRYEVVDVSATPDSQQKDLMKNIAQLLEKFELKPIPYVSFQACDIREALTYLQKAKHIGKIVCSMPEFGETKGERNNVQTFLFNDRSTYLITGGLGGIGLEIAKWMAKSGAKHIVLVGRNAPNEKAAEEIKILQSMGINVIALKCDVSDFNQCQALLESLKLIKDNAPSFPPLRGIMHSAGNLSDGLYEKQTWSKFEDAFDPKIKGAWNLHLLTLGYPLEHFVMFSSISALFGTPGQSNHAAANTFLDSFAHYRNSIGLPATSINWGQWGQVGVAVNIDLFGIKPMTTLQCLSALEHLLKSQCLQKSVCEANFSLVKKMFPITKNYLAEFNHTADDKIGSVQVNSEEFWREYDASLGTEAKIEAVSKVLRAVIRSVLKFESKETIDDHASLQDMGVDSLMMIEMKNIIQSLVGNRAKITVNSVKDCLTINQLATRIVELVSGVEELPPPTREELQELIRKDAELSPAIKPLGPGCKPSEIRTVLITGVSGNLGPYLLTEILKRSHIKKVYCLMRASSKNTPRERLEKALTEKGIASKVNFEILECLTGNIIHPNFGLSKNTYTTLTEEVDAVFNLAIIASFQQLYRDCPESDRDIRTVNVLGTKRVLEFATTGKTKLVYHASATLAVTTLDTDGRMSENWPHIDDFDNMPNDAYPISKFISDYVIGQAVERGVPCKVFRFPFIGGDSRTGGNISVLNNSLMLRMMAYMHLGVMPAFGLPFMIVPVDVCAKMSAEIFLHDQTGFEVYNIHNPKVNDEQELEDIAGEFGFTVEIIEPDEFVEKVSQMEDSEVLIFVKNGAKNEDTRKQLEENIPAAAEEWITGNKEVFISRKLEKLIPGYPDCMESSLTILKRDLWNAKTSGVFDKLGLKK